MDDKSRAWGEAEEAHHHPQYGHLHLQATGSGLPTGASGFPFVERNC